MMKYKHVTALTSTVLLIFLLCFACLTSCAIKITDGEAKAVLDELLPKAAVINDIIWGEGLPIDSSAANDESNTDIYLPISETSPIKTRAELEAAVMAVYSDEVFEWIDSLAFENGDEIMSRYTEVNGRIKVNKNYEKFEMKTEFLTETVRVVGSTPYIVEVELEYLTDGEPGGTETLTLVRADDGSFRLNSPTY